MKITGKFSCQGGTHHALQHKAFSLIVTIAEIHMQIVDVCVYF